MHLRQLLDAVGLKLTNRTCSCPPGTTERVCLIQGTVEALNGVHDFIAEKVREMPQSTQKTEPVSILQPQTTVNPDRVKQVSPSVLRLCVCVSVSRLCVCLRLRGGGVRKRCERSVGLRREKRRRRFSVAELWFPD